MARGILFDTYQPQAPKPAGQGGKPKFAGDSRTAPGPDVEPCAECGNTTGPWWGDAGERFCSRCAPADLKSPGAAS